MTTLFLALMLVQFYFPNQIVCIESDGRTSIESAFLGNCTEEAYQSSLDETCSAFHQTDEVCRDCVDIQLNHDVSLSRSDSEQALLNVVSPTYFVLYAGGFKPHIPHLNHAREQVPLHPFTFVYHPHQTLESIILLI